MSIVGRELSGVGRILHNVPRAKFEEEILSRDFEDGMIVTLLNIADINVTIHNIARISLAFNPSYPLCAVNCSDTAVI